MTTTENPYETEEGFKDIPGVGPTTISKYEVALKPFKEGMRRGAVDLPYRYKVLAWLLKGEVLEIWAVSTAALTSAHGCYEQEFVVAESDIDLNPIIKGFVHAISIVDAASATMHHVFGDMPQFVKERMRQQRALEALANDLPHSCESCDSDSSNS